MKSISATVVLASRNALTGDEIVTFELVMPKFMVAEFNTHRAISRNSRSSRAVPTKKIRSEVWEDPFVFVSWGARNKGMEAVEELSGWRRWLARQTWLAARYPALLAHWVMDKLGVQKQVTNRILEPWMWTTVLATATEWNNFFMLRTDKSAQPEFYLLANLMLEAYRNANFQQLEPGQWHLPYLVSGAVEGSEALLIMSAARCARISRRMHGTDMVSTFDKDKNTHDTLVMSQPKHWSPTEHQAMALETKKRCGNFVGWMQYRKFFNNESGGDYNEASDSLLSW